MHAGSWNMEDLKGLEPSNFLPKALSLMQYQATNNVVYREWIESMKVALDRVKSLEEIPFLPIDFLRPLLFIQDRNVLVFILKAVALPRI